MKKFYLVLLIIIAASTSCKKDLESKFSVKNTSSNDFSLLSEDLQLIVNLIDSEIKINSKQAFIHANQLVKIAQKNKDKEGEAYSFYKRGYIQDQYLGEYGKAIADYFEALKIYQELNIYHAISSSYLGIAGIYYKLHEFDKALIYYQQALTNIQQINNKQKESKLYYAIANCHMALRQDLSIIINDYTKSLTLLQDLKDEIGIGNCYNLMASAYYFISQDFHQAKKYYLQATIIFQAENKMEELGNVYYNLGLLHNEMKELAIGTNYFKQAIEIGKKYNYPDLILSGEFQLGKMQANLKNYSQAITHSLAALSAIHHDELTKSEITHFLSQSYEAIGNKDKALAYSNQTIELNKNNEKNKLTYLSKENQQRASVHDFEMKINKNPITYWNIGSILVGVGFLFLMGYILARANYQKKQLALLKAIKIAQTRNKELKNTLTDASNRMLDYLQEIAELKKNI